MNLLLRYLNSTVLSVPAKYFLLPFLEKIYNKAAECFQGNLKYYWTTLPVTLFILKYDNKSLLKPTEKGLAHIPKNQLYLLEFLKKHPLSIGLCPFTAKRAHIAYIAAGRLQTLSSRRICTPSLYEPTGSKGLQLWPIWNKRNLPNTRQ